MDWNKKIIINEYNDNYQNNYNIDTISFKKCVDLEEIVIFKPEIERDIVLPNSIKKFSFTIGGLINTNKIITNKKYYIKKEKHMYKNYFYDMNVLYF